MQASFSDGEVSSAYLFHVRSLATKKKTIKDIQPAFQYLSSSTSQRSILHLTTSQSLIADDLNPRQLEGEHRRWSQEQKKRDVTEEARQTCF